MSNETDGQLVTRTRGGDVSAFEAIVERHRAVVVARTNARLGSFADAEDIDQEAFVRAYFHLGELRDLDEPIRVILKALERREITPWQAEKVITNLGGVW